MLLDLGCGLQSTKAPGHIGIDIVPEADIVWDLNKGLPMGELRERYKIGIGQVEGMRCHQVIEHLRTIIPLMNDCYEILKEGAIFELSTPLAGTTQFWQDPTHIKGYVPESFQYFAQNSMVPDAQKEYGITARFKIVRIWMEQEWNMRIDLTK